MEARPISLLPKVRGKGVGAHTTSFDRLIAGNGTWQDVRLWRGRAFDRQLCDRYFRVTCSLVEASPEVWTNPWSHVLISILMPNSWVPFHQGHTNGQLTYHLPVMLPEAGAELALLERGGTLAEQETGTVSWTLGRTLVFDDSFTHAVRYRHAWSEAHSSGGAPRMLLLMRAWHPELEMKERMALREFIRRGGEEEPEGYETCTQLLVMWPCRWLPVRIGRCCSADQRPNIRKRLLERVAMCVRPELGQLGLSNIA
eukprot:g22584.t1